MSPHKIKAKVIGEISVIDGQEVGFVYDTHLFSSQPTMTEEQFMSLAVNSKQTLTLFGGDNGDLRNCLKKELLRALRFIASYQSLLIVPEPEGNHDGTQSTMREYVIIKVLDKHTGKVLRSYAMGHGDWESNPDSMYKQRGKAKGCSWFKWNILRRGIEAADYLLEARVPKDMLGRCFQTLAELNVDHIILGHKHPSHMTTYAVRKGTLFLMPRGLTTMVV